MATTGSPDVLLLRTTGNASRTLGMLFEINTGQQVWDGFLPEVSPRGVVIEITYKVMRHKGFPGGLMLVDEIFPPL